MGLDVGLDVGLHVGTGVVEVRAVGVRGMCGSVEVRAVEVRMSRSAAPGGAMVTNVAAGMTNVVLEWLTMGKG